MVWPVNSHLFVLTVYLLQCCSIVIADECKSRNFGHGSTVCVCDAGHCDTLPSVRLPKAGSALLVTSTKAGLRWHTSINNFSYEENNHIPSKIYQEYRVDRSTAYQKILGFGGAFTDAAGLNILSLPQPLQEVLLRSYYSKDGLEYNLGRVPVGGADFSTRAYTYDDLPAGQTDPDLHHFSLAHEDHKYKIPLMLRAQAMTDTHIKWFGSAWGAPAWMKDNNSIAGKGKLLPAMYRTWANYHLRFLRSYGEFNLTFWGLTTQNEPSDGLVEGFQFNAIGWTPEEQAEWLGKHLGPVLHNNSLGHLNIMVLDDNRVFLPKWVDTIMEDGVAGQYVSGVAVHWYTDWFTPTQALDLTHLHHPHLFILYTEACTGQWPWQPLKVVLGSWVRAEDYAADIIENMNHWVSGWTDWNLALDIKGGPNWVKNYVDSPIIVNAPRGEFYKQPMYYTLAHFTKFLTEGSQRISLVSLQSSGVEEYLHHCAFIRPDNSTVAVFLNKGHTGIEIQLVDGGGRLDVSLGPHSIVTVAWRV